MTRAAACSRLAAGAGRRISTESGEPVLLRGVNLGGWLVKEGYILHFPGEAFDAPSEIDRAIVDLAGPVEARSCSTSGGRSG